jgi:cytoskeletal protein CcmA (bactofilin family)
LFADGACLTVKGRIDEHSGSSKGYRALWFGYVFWFFAVWAYVIKAYHQMFIWVALTVLAFLSHLFKGSNVFRKKLQQNKDIISITEYLSQPVDKHSISEDGLQIANFLKQEAESYRSDREAKEKKSDAIMPTNCAVVGVNMSFEGDIKAEGKVYIHGHVKGSIMVFDGLVRILYGGSVAGNITCKELVVDGMVNGKCTAGQVYILENGYIDGVLTYDSLSVSNGGGLSGKSTMRKKAPTLSAKMNS